MPLQSAKNVKVAFAQEVTYNTPPDPATAEYLRFVPGPGSNLTSVTIRSAEQRADALTTMGRNGSEQAPGTYPCEMSLRSHDTIYAAVMRAQWQAALPITNLTPGAPATVLIEANKIIGDVGNWGTLGIKDGDVVRFQGLPDADNNDRNIRIGSVSALELTTLDDLTANPTPSPVYNMMRAKKLSNPDTPFKRTFGVEHVNVDVNGSQLFGGVRWVGMKINGTPDGMANVEFTTLGAAMQVLADADSPYFTDPIAHNTTPLIFADARINVAGKDIVVATAIELNYVINAATQPVIGTKTSPDVFDNDASLSGTFSMIREDFDNVIAFKDEVEFALHILLIEPETDPQDFIAIYVPRCKYTAADAPLGGDGAMIENLPFQTGAQTPTEFRDATLLTISTSAPFA